MNKKDIIKMALIFSDNSGLNIIEDDKAISQSVAGMKIYASPLFGFGDANDNYFREFKKRSVIGKHHLLPDEWLPGARTVISFFLPFTPAVKKGNRKDMSWPSEEWLHGRIEGQVFLNELCRHLASQLADTGVLLPRLMKGSVHGPVSTAMLPVILKNRRHLQVTGQNGTRHSYADSVHSAFPGGSLLQRESPEGSAV
jgi:hypothetical protein